MPNWWYTDIKGKNCSAVARSGAAGREKGGEMPQAVKLVLVCIFCISLITAIVYLVKWLW